jgi:hypothetical protein
MSRNSMFHIRFGSLLLVTSLVCVAQIAAPRLRDGDMFPQVAGQTPNGKALQLPPIGTDKPIGSPLPLCMPFRVTPRSCLSLPGSQL